MRRLARSAALLTLFTAVTVSLASAQNPGPPPAREQEQREQSRLLEMFLDQATIELDLSAEQRQGLQRALRETFVRRARLAREGRELQRSIREALADPSSDDAVFERLSEASLDLKRRELDLLDWQRGRLAEVLTARQTLRFMLMQEQLARRIQAMRRDREPR